jgi:two-component system response regulator PilR (NtrC family)
VRELENIIEKGVALANTSIMLPESLELSQFKITAQVRDAAAQRPEIQIPPEGVQLDELLERYERDYIEKALSAARGSISRAAKLLGISFRSLRYRLEKCKMSEHELKE